MNPSFSLGWRTGFDCFDPSDRPQAMQNVSVGETTFGAWYGFHFRFFITQTEAVYDLLVWSIDIELFDTTVRTEAKQHKLMKQNTLSCLCAGWTLCTLIFKSDLRRSSAY